MSSTEDSFFFKKRLWYYKEERILGLGNYDEVDYATYEDGGLFRLMVRRSSKTRWHAFSDGYADVVTKESQFLMSGTAEDGVVVAKHHKARGRYCHVIDVHFQRMTKPADEVGEMMGAGFLFLKQLSSATLPEWPLDIAIVRKHDAQIAFNQWPIRSLKTPHGAEGSKRWIFQGEPPTAMFDKMQIKPMLRPEQALKDVAAACHVCGEPAFMRDPYGHPVHATCEAEWREKELMK